MVKEIVPRLREVAYQVRDEGDLAEKGVQNDGVRVRVHLALLDGVGVILGMANVRLRFCKHAPTYNWRPIQINYSKFKPSYVVCTS